MLEKVNQLKRSEQKDKSVICECGQVNPEGTELCSSCGKPFDAEQQQLNMRYEGAARRSQTYNKTFIDKIWNFFSSVKVGIWLLVITLITSSFGTIFPQQLFIPSNANPYLYYPEEYGLPGQLYVSLGFHNLYSSWWYIGLLVLIGISLTISSIDRIIPLYRALKKQRVKRHKHFLERQRVYAETQHNKPSQAFTIAEESLRQKRYSIRQEDGALLAEKGRFSRWGPYIVHLGLIIFLLGALLRILPGNVLDTYVWVRDGERLPLPGTNGQYYVESKGFSMEAYDVEDFPNLVDRIGEGQIVPREFRTEAILFENQQNEEGLYELVEVKRHNILVNDPLTYEGLKLFQADFVPNEFSQFTFSLEHQASQRNIGELVIDLYNPEGEYSPAEGYTVQILEYYPDFIFGPNNELLTESNIPNKPAFIFNVITPTNATGEKIWVYLGQTISLPGIENEYSFRITDLRLHSVTGLMVRLDRSLPIIYTGLTIVMFGLFLCFYWQHRRVWIQREGEQLILAAHTNKNWFGLTKELESVIDDAKLDVDKEGLDREVMS